MPGLMIVLALLAPAVNSELKDPWAAAPRAVEITSPPAIREQSGDLRNPFETKASSDLRDPFEAKASGDLRDPFETKASGDLRNPFETTASAPTSADLRNPFEATSPPPKPAETGSEESGPPPAATHAGDSRDPFNKATSQGHKARRSSELVDPFRTPKAARVKSSARARAASLELRNPFITSSSRRRTTPASGPRATRRGAPRR